MKPLLSLRSAFGFLTRLPVGPWPLQKDLHGISAWLPLVGLVVGALAGAAAWGASLLLAPVPVLLAGLAGCACWVAVTGGLHLDGVADCGDGLPVEVSRERRLEIMKDSRLGTFGGTFLFFNLLLKTAAIGCLATRALTPWEIVLPCALAGLLARTQIFIAMRFPSARPGGMGDAFRQGTTWWHAAVAVGVALGACLLLGESGWVALATALGASLAVLFYAARRLGGVTGDVFGWSVETVEWAVLLSFCRAGAPALGGFMFQLPQ